MAYNPGGQPPYNPQMPFGAPPPPPKSGMSTGAKVAIFGCIGLIFVVAIIIVVAIVLGVAFAPKNVNVSYGNSNSSSTSRNDNSPSSSNRGSTTNSGSSTSGVSVNSIDLAVDENGEAGDTVSSFSPSDRTMYFLIELGNSQPGVKVTIDLTAVDLPAGGQEGKLGSVDVLTTSVREDKVTAHFTNRQDWVAGTYRVDVSIDGKQVKSRTFEVE